MIDKKSGKFSVGDIVIVTTHLNHILPDCIQPAKIKTIDKQGYCVLWDVTDDLLRAIVHEDSLEFWSVFKKQYGFDKEDEHFNEVKPVMDAVESIEKYRLSLQELSKDIIKLRTELTKMTNLAHAIECRVNMYTNKQAKSLETVKNYIAIQ